MDLFLDFRGVSKSIEPNSTGQFPEPRHLAFCITPRVLLDHTDSFVPCATDLYVFHDTAIADCPHRLGGRPYSSLDQCLHFIHKPGLKHVAHSLVDALDRRFPGWVQSDGVDIIPRQW